MIFVNQTAVRKLGRNAQTAYGNVFPGCCLSVEHLFHNVLRSTILVLLPSTMFQCRGEYDLVQRVEHAGELLVGPVSDWVPGDVGPIGNHELIGDPAEEEDARHRAAAR